MNARAWSVTLAAAALMALVVGGRSGFGLFVSPLNSASGIGLATLSLSLALGQLGIGVAQPWVGALADRVGAARLIVIGAALLALTTVLPVWSTLPAVVGASAALSTVAGSAVASNGLLIGEVTRAVPPARSGFAVGLVGAGTSAGLLLLGDELRGGRQRGHVRRTHCGSESEHDHCAGGQHQQHCDADRAQQVNDGQQMARIHVAQRSADGQAAGDVGATGQTDP